MNPMHGCIAWMIPLVSSPSAKALELASEALQVTGWWCRLNLCFFHSGRNLPRRPHQVRRFLHRSGADLSQPGSHSKRRRSPDTKSSLKTCSFTSATPDLCTKCLSLWSFLVSRFEWERRCNLSSLAIFSNFQSVHR